MHSFRNLRGSIGITRLRGLVKMKVLIVEDDKELSEAISAQLEKEGYVTDVCHAGDEAIYYLKKKVHDIIIMDRMLPEMDGLTITEKIRKQNITTPIIMVTAMNGIYDRIDGLDAGADDYLVKPFAMEELLARIRALLRRPRTLEQNEILRFADLSYDVVQKIVIIHEETMSLSKRESALLEYFMRNHTQILSREQILARVWGNDEVEDGNIDNYIYFLRRRLKSAKSKVKIKTIYGIGYALEEVNS